SVLLSGEEQISYAVQFLPVCGVMLFAVDMLFVFRNGVQGMGFPLVPMISGILEMILRTGTIALFIGQFGFRATAYAEICAWVGACTLNGAAFFVIYARESGRALFAGKKQAHRKKHSLAAQ
ncbi:MAG: MATE family efflux transporter, partial [Oscillospiraceae bacterium]|nr:MATE family efflux transporter [Oscillospiraceae bacterium]